MECFYYIRDKQNRPIITVCIIYSGGYVSRGIALCSPNDNPCKKRGRGKAYSRALKALNYEGSYGRIQREEVKEHEKLLKENGIKPGFLGYLLKVDFDPKITEFEWNLLALGRED